MQLKTIGEFLSVPFGFVAGLESVLPRIKDMHHQLMTILLELADEIRTGYCFRTGLFEIQNKDANLHRGWDACGSHDAGVESVQTSAGHDGFRYRTQ
ncbi:MULTISPECIES: hypothetical protein [unclassified Rhizobium]|uniref:hypothetical protein n=1 Tax=unclassified Rhizobium TaxID=2613769 RepID=UPI0007139207|nr:MULTISPECIES: hypothetical protein [unclassified Rhizobium]KQT06848.1 hypothetical protein ASG50_13610 [Rhizobium sp. Leaf386]KQT98843.1 hypothetical protein ASG68_29905 [Rhizobium sp. Leaf453]